MENSLLFDLLFKDNIYGYREKLKKEDNCLTKWVNEAWEVLEKNLSAEQLKLVDDYKSEINLRKEDIDFETGIRILNYGVKIGMQLQKAFEEMDDE